MNLHMKNDFGVVMACDPSDSHAWHFSTYVPVSWFWPTWRMTGGSRLEHEQKKEDLRSRESQKLEASELPPAVLL